MDTYAHGYGNTGHYARPGTHTSYCGRELMHEPNTPIAARICKACAKAEQADRIAAEQVAADHAVEGPSLAERAHVAYATVGTGRRIHFSPRNDDTLCGREVTEYVDGSDLLALLNKGRELCTSCIKAAEHRAYALSLAATSPLAAAAVELAETVEATLAEREQAEAFGATARAADAVEYAEEADAKVATVEEAEALYAAALVTEAEADAGTWRGEWIGEQPAALTLFDVQQPAEQGALFTDTAPAAEETGPVRVRVRFEASALKRHAAKAATDRAAFRAEMDARKAAERARYGQPEQAVARRVIEGVIVEHAGTSEGSSPRNATHPHVTAAREALSGLAVARLTDRHDVMEPTADEQTVRGYMIEPRGGRRVAVYWLEGGRIIRHDDRWHGASLDCLAHRLTSRGWKVEPLLASSQCLFAHQPE